MTPTSFHETSPSPDHDKDPNPDDLALHALHLCSGYGGFELALRSVARVRTVAHVERDAYAAAVLVERMAQARLDHAPVWDDLTTFDGRPWRRRVDLITAGFPCQPFSAAGQKRGTDDHRWIWPGIADIIHDVQPRFVILENVPQVIKMGLRDVLGDLAALGFDAEWGVLGASDVGAPHRRKRFWLVAMARADSDGREAFGGESERDGLARHDADRRHGALVADTAGVGRGWEGERPAEEERARWVADVQAGGHWAWPPGRDDASGWDRWVAQGGPQPVLRRFADGPPNGLADAIHLGGNGLVPQAAAHAIQSLLNRAGWTLD